MKEKARGTGEIVKLLHIYGITQSELAEEMGCSKVWVSMLLNEAKTVEGSEKRMRDAISAIKVRRSTAESK